MGAIDDMRGGIAAADEAFDAGRADALYAMLVCATASVAGHRQEAEHLAGKLRGAERERNTARADLAEERGNCSEIETDFARFSGAVWEALGQTMPGAHRLCAGRAVEAVAALRAERDTARDAIHLLAVRVTQATQAGDDPAAVDATPEGAVEAVRVLRADLDTVKAQIGVIEDVSLNAQAAHDKATAEAEQLRAELGHAHDELRVYASLPTYEPRTVAPMVSEVAAHEAVGGAWLVVWALAGLRTAIISGDFDHGEWLSVVGTWVPLDTRRLPCAWPVVAVEGGA